mmetsp:Transcript_10942/g.16606  ORF Transcript_10942/g.16606 Transcript_10942/m.16606 type:complete len:104 (+) Transcript_10942:2366-2677(+)
MEWVLGAVENIEAMIAPSLGPTERDAADWVEGVFDNIRAQLSMRTTERDAAAWVTEAVNNVEARIVNNSGDLSQRLGSIKSNFERKVANSQRAAVKLANRHLD